jgi:hypothetical protein
MYRTNRMTNERSGRKPMARCVPWLLAAIGLFSAEHAPAQIQAIATEDGSTLAAALNPSGLTITSVTKRYGAAGQIGTFTNFSQPPIIFPDGIALSTGLVTSMLPGTFPSNNRGGAGAVEIQNYALATGAIFNYSLNRDPAAIEVRFTLPAASSVKFDFIFGSVEYPEYVAQFTDAFVAFLDNLDPANQICFDLRGSAVQVGQTFANRVTTADVNTAFGGTHGLIQSLTTTTPVLSAGEHVIWFEVCDVNDGILDSAAFIANLRAETGSAGTEATPFTIRLGSPTPGIVPGGSYTVRASSTVPPSPMSGCQIALEFDETRLRLDGVTPVGSGPMGLEISEQIDNSAGTLRYALGLADPSAPLTGPTDLCDLHFTVLPTASGCGVATLASFAPVGPFTTRFTSLAAEPVVPVLASLPPVALDTTAPVLSGYPAGDITVACDAGSTFGALVPLGAVTATDNCDGSLAVTATGIPAGSVFPIGATTVSWSATDSVGNSTTVTRTVTVQNHQLLDVAVELPGFGIAPMTRALRVSAGGVVRVGTVTLTESVQIPGTGAVVAVRGVATGVEVPVTASLGCVAAKDPVHSLSSASPSSVSGVRWRSSHVLHQGDSNDDEMVEIVDYALWVLDLASPVSQSARSNFNGDAHVNNGDFGYVSLNFFRVGQSCSGALDGARPRDRITVKDLRRMGLGHLSVADLNGDGWVDLRDIQMHMQGGAMSPAQPADEHEAQAW